MPYTVKMRSVYLLQYAVGHTVEGVRHLSYQNVTGPIMANSHPGSYCGQDAYNGMLVTENVVYRKRTIGTIENERECRNAELYARSTSDSAKWG